MTILARIEKFIFESRRPVFLGALLALLLIKTGIWYYPNTKAAILIAQAPFAEIQRHHSWWSWLSMFSASLVGATNTSGFILLHFVYAAAFIITFLTLIWRRVKDERTARIATIIFFALPVSGTAFYWIGMDGLTLLLFALAFAASRHLIISLIVGVAIGMQHFEQGVVGFGVLLLSSLLSRGRLKLTAFSIVVLIGVVLGKAALLAIIAANHISVRQNKISWFTAHYERVISEFLQRAQVVYWGTLGAGWFVALRFFDQKETRLAFFLALVPLLGLMALVADQTRVFAVCSLPLLYAWWLGNQQFLKTVSGKETAFLFAAAALIPYFWVWRGVPHSSTLPYDIMYILHQLFGWFDIPAHPAKWPMQ